MKISKNHEKELKSNFFRISENILKIKNIFKTYFRKRFEKNFAKKFSEHFL